MPRPAHTSHAIATAVLALAALSSAASGATFTVTHQGESGPGSLREAIDLANAAPGQDFIRYDFSGQGTATPPFVTYLESPLPTITDDLTVIGPGASALTLSILPAVDPFTIMPVSGDVTLHVEGLRFLKGSGERGGAIRIDGSGQLNLRACVFTQCTSTQGGGAVDVRASGDFSALLVDSSFSENHTFASGGAICIERDSGVCDVVIRASSFHQNAAKSADAGSNGGAICIKGPGLPGSLSVRDSTFSSNTAPSAASGGAIAFDARGGNAELVNCTLVANSAGSASALLAVHSDVRLLNCTLTSNNSAALDAPCVSADNGKDLTCINTIISGNSAGGVFRDFADLQPVGGHHNLVGVGSTLTSENANILGVTNPHLSPLLTIGGSTATMALKPWSPALDAGSSVDAPETDQRGQPRIADGDNNASPVCDIGAFETQSFIVTTTDSSGPGSLRQAILSNNLAGGGFVRFAINNGPRDTSTHTITLDQPLPPSQRPIYIDAWSQGGPAYAGPPLIEISGELLASSVNGLAHTGSDSIIRGLAFNAFNAGTSDTGFGMTIRTNVGVRNWVYGCYFGVALDGLSPKPNGQGGIAIYQHANVNLLGTDSDGVNDEHERCIIAGSTNPGVRSCVYIGSNSNVIAGNSIGVGADGRSLLNPTHYGVWLDAGGTNNRVGSYLGSAFPEHARNIIAGARGAGVGVSTGNGAGNSISGNYIGLDSTGQIAIPNAVGVLVYHSITTEVGGPSPLLGNVISGNSSHGIIILGSQSAGCVVLGNIVGLDPTGSHPIPNAGSGLVIDNGAQHTRVGTFGDSSRRDPFRRNIFAANRGNGVHINGASTIGSRVMGNLIGLTADASPMGNAATGVLISAGASNSVIGSEVSGMGNTIAYNAVGISVVDAASTDNAFLANAIHSNNALGIDLGADGVTPNAPAGQARSGPNNLQNRPFINSVGSDGLITFTHAALPSTWYRIDFYSNSAADSTGFGEGAHHLGYAILQTNEAGTTGQQSFLARTDSVRPMYTATATQLLRGSSGEPASTSEFSNARKINTAPQTQPTFAAGLEDTDVVLTLPASDADPAAALYGRIITLPATGTLLQFGSLTPITTTGAYLTDTQLRVIYRPAPGTFAPRLGDFEFAIHDGIEQTTSVVARVDVSPVADTPSISDASTIEGRVTSSGLVVMRNAADGEEVTHVQITAISSGRLLLADAVTPIAVGEFIPASTALAGFRFEPAAGFHGLAHVTIRASTSADASGLGGDPVTATITVRPNAHTPSITSVETNEDTLSHAGIVISPNSVNTSEVTHYKIVALSHGQLLLADGTSPVPVGSFITAPQAAAGLRYMPDANDFGSVQLSVAASISASDEGIAHAPATATIVVHPVNDAPTVSASSPPVVLVLGEPQTIASWATFSPGPENESGQSLLNYSVSSISNPALFSVAPSVDTLGTLRYTPAPNTRGTSTFTLRARDNAGTALGGVDTSIAQVFTISVLPNNQQPSFLATDPPAVLEGTGVHVIPGFVISFIPGPPEESQQTALEYIVDQVSNASMFAELPSISPTGALSYILAPSGSGSSTFRVRVRDSGGTDHGGVDLSEPARFTIVARPAAACRELTIDARSSCTNLLLTLSDVHATPANPGPGATQSVTSTFDFTKPLPIGTSSIPVRVTYSDGLTSSCTARVTVLADDCNANGSPDSCDIAWGTSDDCNADGIPDDCQSIWDNGLPPPDGAKVNGQLSHFGGAVINGAKVADDFYLPPGAVYKLFGFTGTMLTDTPADLRKARLEFYEDCDGMPTPVAFQSYTQFRIVSTQPSEAGFDLVTYAFDFCSTPLMLEGGKSYWVSLIGLSTPSGQDSSYWVATTGASNPGGTMGSGAKKTQGIPGSAPTYIFEPWSLVDECCMGCVNFAYRVRGEACPIVWNNGIADRDNPAGDVSGADVGIYPTRRAIDNFVVKPCTDIDVCYIDAWVYSNCPAPVGFVEIYENICGVPALAYTHRATTTSLLPTGATLTRDGVSYTGYRMAFCNLDWKLPGGKTYWLSAGVDWGFSLAGRSFFAYSSDCSRTCTTKISPGCELDINNTGYFWQPSTHDYAFRVFRAGDKPIAPSGGSNSGGILPNPCPSDINRDGASTVADIFEFLAHWFNGCQ